VREALEMVGLLYLTTRFPLTEEDEKVYSDRARDETSLIHWTEKLSPGFFSSFCCQIIIESLLCRGKAVALLGKTFLSSSSFCGLGRVHKFFE
jgi:hypothetical protein